MKPEELTQIRARDAAIPRVPHTDSAHDRRVLLAEVDRLQRIIDGYDRTPAEERAKAAETERDDWHSVARAARRDHVALLDPIRDEPEIADMKRRIDAQDPTIVNPLAESVGALIERLMAEKDDLERRLIARRRMSDPNREIYP